MQFTYFESSFKLIVVNVPKGFGATNSSMSGFWLPTFSMPVDNFAKGDITVEEATEIAPLVVNAAPSSKTLALIIIAPLFTTTIPLNTELSFRVIAPSIFQNTFFD